MAETSSRRNQGAETQDGAETGREEGRNMVRGEVNRAIALADNISSIVTNDSFLARFDLSHLPHDEWKDHLSCWCIQFYPTCIWSLICPCILAGQVSEAIHWRRSFSIIFYFCLGVLAIGLFTYLSKSLGLLLFTSVILFTLAFQLRSNLRRLLRLPGGACSDCCLSFCCPWCVIAQAARHVFRFRSPCDCLPWRVTESPPSLPIAAVDIAPIEVCSVEVISTPPTSNHNCTIRSSRPPVDNPQVPQAYFVSHSPHPPSYSYNRVSC